MRQTLRENPIVTRSRAALVAAATRLLDERPAAAISVTDVVGAAGMSRPTFYQHFDDLGAAVAAAGLARVADAFREVTALAEDPSSASPLTDAVGEVVGRLAGDAAFYARVQESQGGPEFHAGVLTLSVGWLRRQPRLAHLDEDDTFWEFLAAGMVWTVTRHLAALCLDPRAPRPEAELARILLAVAPTPDVASPDPASHSRPPARPAGHR